MSASPQELGVYQDHRKPELLALRRNEIGNHMAHVYSAIPNFSLAQRAQSSRGIVEIGSGMGAVTEELRKLFPNSPITAIDRDTDPVIAETAQRNGATFIAKDAKEITEEEWQKLIAEKDVDQIVAMRTSGEVATQMIATLRKAGFRGAFIFSLLGQRGQLDAETINGLNRKREGIGVTLREDQWYTERAFVYPFI